MDALSLSVIVGSTAIVGAYGVGAVLPWPGVHDWLVPGTIWRAPPGSVALTFDDGPDPIATPRVLDLLRAAGARATFFPIAERVQRFPALARRIVEEGHATGIHGWRHRALLTQTGSALDDEFGRCQSTLTAVLGRAPLLLRPPYGRRDFRVYRAARRRGLTPVMWSFDSRDWLPHDAAGMTRRLADVASGDVVLLHDGLPKRAAMLDALGALLDRLRATRLPAVALCPEGVPRRDPTSTGAMGA